MGSNPTSGTRLRSRPTGENEACHGVARRAKPDSPSHAKSWSRTTPGQASLSFSTNGRKRSLSRRSPPGRSRASLAMALHGRELHLGRPVTVLNQRRERSPVNPLFFPCFRGCGPLRHGLISGKTIRRRENGGCRRIVCGISRSREVRRHGNSDWRTSGRSE